MLRQSGMAGQSNGASLEFQFTSGRLPHAQSVTPMVRRAMHRELPWLAALALLVSGCEMPDRFRDAGADGAESLEYPTLIPDEELRSLVPDPDEHADLTLSN